jgi:dihydroorotate dehydrogenase
MNLYRHLLRPVLFRLNPESCHDAAIRFLQLVSRIPGARAFLAAGHHFSHPSLATTLCGVSFQNPVGLAAGFDKSGRAIHALAALDFGHIEIGSVSADASAGNPKPRLFRLIADRALLVHYGLPNDGSEIIAKRLSQKPAPVPIGINIVTTNRGLHAPPDSDDAIIKDYLTSVRRLKDNAAYIALNLSCPNTAHGRDFFTVPGNTRLLLTELQKLNITIPLFLKISPAGGPARIDALLEEIDGLSFVSGFAINLTPAKPRGLQSRSDLWNRPGAISGKPISTVINEAIQALHARINPDRYKIIAAGGIFSAEDAYLKIRLGASLVQLLTSLIYEGPGIASAINRGLSQLLTRDGFSNIAQAVGTLTAVPA